MRLSVISKIYLLLLAACCSYQSIAQCVSISNLPDTIIACKNTQVQLNATVTSTGLLNILDTLWTPASGLTNPNIINPVASVGIASTSYKLTITALTPFNFVNNGDFSNGNTGFTSSYLLGTGGTWGLLSNEGTYAVTNNPFSVHTNFASFGDHTTGTGQMMVVNGSSTPNISVWCQTITVIPNSTYDFSAWVATCVTSSPAILQFSINGNLIGTPFNAPAVTGVWSQFQTTWTSGTNTTATICITNQNTAASGNDFAIDDITFRERCTTSDSVYLKVVNVQPSINTDIHLGCIEDTVIFSGVNNGETPDQYIWDFGDGTGDTVQNPTHIYTTQGVYNVKLVTKKNGCKDSSIVQVNTVHVLTIDFAISDDSICAGENIQFTSTAGSTFPLTYYWDFGDGTTSTMQNPSHTYNIPGIYTVTHAVQDQVPCFDTITKQVVVSTVPIASVFISDSVLCEGKAITVRATMDTGYSTFNWNFGDGNYFVDESNLLHAYDSSGTYNITLNIDYIVCPDVSITKTVNIFPIPRIDLGRDTSMCPFSQPITLYNPYFNAADKYLWNTGDSSYAIAVRHPGIYSVTAVSPAGCVANDSIEVFKSCYIDVPNAFTPNDDGVNDYFLPRQLLSKKLTKFSMKIFNRWGQIIFETNKIDGRGWDGKFNEKPQPTGVYVYMIEAEIDQQWTEKYTGNVTLMR